MKRRLAAVGFLSLIGLQEPVLADDVCRTIFDSYVKLSEVPIYQQTVHVKRAIIAEQIMSGDTLYTRDGDTWSKQELGVGMRKTLLTTVMKGPDSLKDCRAGDSEAVDGVSARQYTYTLPPVAGLGDLGPQRVWIGEADGLPHKLNAESQGTETLVHFDGIRSPL